MHVYVCIYVYFKKFAIIENIARNTLYSCTKCCTRNFEFFFFFFIYPERLTDLDNSA